MIIKLKCTFLNPCFRSSSSDWKHFLWDNIWKAHILFDQEINQVLGIEMWGSKCVTGKTWFYTLAQETTNKSEERRIGNRVWRAVWKLSVTVLRPFSVISVFQSVVVSINSPLQNIIIFDLRNYEVFALFLFITPQNANESTHLATRNLFREFLFIYPKVETVFTGALNE